jgi:hypothetical protein
VDDGASGVKTRDGKHNVCFIIMISQDETVRNHSEIGQMTRFSLKVTLIPNLIRVKV